MKRVFESLGHIESAGFSGKVCEFSLEDISHSPYPALLYFGESGGRDAGIEVGYIAALKPTRVKEASEPLFLEVFLDLEASREDFLRLGDLHCFTTARKSDRLPDHRHLSLGPGGRQRRMTPCIRDGQEMDVGDGSLGDF